MKVITAYKTTDSQVFESQEEAKYHEDEITLERELRKIFERADISVNDETIHLLLTQASALRALFNIYGAL